MKTVKKQLSIFDQHRLKIAKDTMKMNPIFINLLGGMTLKEAKKVIKTLD